MFIQTEPTPNPTTLKFLPGRQVMPAGTADFTSPEAAAPSPLASRLFGVSGVIGVFLGGDFVTVTKADNEDWQLLKPLILGAIMEHYTSGAPVIETAAVADTEAGSEEDDEIVVQIKDLIETRVRPVVARDGGDIVFRDFRDGVVYLHMQGACSGCPSSTMTLKNGIENMLRHFVPEVRLVEAVN